MHVIYRVHWDLKYMYFIHFLFTSSLTVLLRNKSNVSQQGYALPSNTVPLILPWKLKYRLHQGRYLPGQNSWGTCKSGWIIYILFQKLGFMNLSRWVGENYDACGYT